MLVRQFQSIRVRLALPQTQVGRRVIHASKFGLHGGHGHSHHSDNKSSSRELKSSTEPSSSSWFGHGHSHGSGHGHSHGGPLDVEDKSGALRKVTVYGAAVNVALSIGKGVAGVMGNSAAMIADAAHSLSDLISDFVTIWVLKEAHKPPDHDHPYGHGKFESIGSLTLATVLVGTGVGIGLHSLHILQVGCANIGLEGSFHIYSEHFDSSTGCSPSPGFCTNSTCFRSCSCVCCCQRGSLSHHKYIHFVCFFNVIDFVSSFLDYHSNSSCGPKTQFYCGGAECMASSR
jgi:hypothetical protein